MNHKKQLYIIAFVIAPVLGAFAQLMAGEALFSIWDFPAALIFVLLLFIWYRLDTNERGLQRHIWGNCAFVYLTAIAMPVYLFKSRGWKKGIKTTLVFFTLLLFWSLLEGLGALAVRLVGL